LLGLLTAPTVPARAPRVLGVDEFAFRKGCTYGTVLVDVEAGWVVDVLPMRGFAGFLRQDLDAVTAGLNLRWSSGVVEGHVNRVKSLKRAMYGRASFRPLPIRILTRP
jgi:transposase